MSIFICLVTRQPLNLYPWPTGQSQLTIPGAQLPPNRRYRPVAAVAQALRSPMSPLVLILASLMCTAFVHPCMAYDEVHLTNGTSSGRI